MVYYQYLNDYTDLRVNHSPSFSAEYIVKKKLEIDCLGINRQRKPVKWKKKKKVSNIKFTSGGKYV